MVEKRLANWVPLCTAQELRRFCTFLKGQENIQKQRISDTDHDGLQNLKYLPSVPLRKIVACNRPLLNYTQNKLALHSSACMVLKILIMWSKKCKFQDDVCRMLKIKDLQNQYMVYMDTVQMQLSYKSSREC